MFQRIAIVNRGEPAMRLIRAVRELGPGFTTIALYTEADRRSLFVREADEAVRLADSPRRSAYLDLQCLEQGLREARAEAAWVGWGFVAEDARFAELCERLGVVFIGPTPASMRVLGDKIAAKRVAEEADLAVAPWSGGPVATLDEARRHAETLGLPVLIKASAGGGGRGMRLVRELGDLDHAFAAARGEAEAAFGDGTVFLERAVTGARHVEVQIIGDTHGTVWAAGVRDCTMQRRHQKVLEEAPSPALEPSEARALCASAVRLAHRVRYRGAGTVEFLFDPDTRAALFMEVNTRLQVEHPVTEVTTGLDLVKLQLHVATGAPLTGDPPPTTGHAVEVRVCAEDAERQFAPAPGTVVLCRLPSGPGVRVDAGIAEGDEVPPAFDSLIAKIIAHGRDRAEALARLRRALMETTVAVQGGTTNRGFLLALLDRPEVRDAAYDTGWLDRLAVRGEQAPTAHADVALLAAAVEAAEAELAVEQAQFFAAAARGRPTARPRVGHRVELRHRGADYHFEVRCLGPGEYRVDTGEARLAVGVEDLGAFERRLTCLGHRRRVLSVRQGLEHVIEVDGVPHRVSRDAAGIIRATMPAIVLGVDVRAGDAVERGDRLVVLESMKMELSITAPFSGRVREVLIQPNQHVAAGSPLLALEPPDDRAGHLEDAARVTFVGDGREGTEDQRAAWSRVRDTARRLLLGYDVDSGEARALVEQWGATARVLAPADPALLRDEDELLDTFTDLHALFRRPPAAELADGGGPRPTEEYLVTYLRAPEARGAGLPESFLARLQRVLGRYGVPSLDRTPALDASLLRIARAAGRAAEQLPAIMGVLDRRLEHLATLGRELGTDDFGERLDRIVAVAEGRFPALADLAREAKYRFIDRPLLERTREAVYAEARAALARAGALRDGPERAALVDRLVECPQPLVSLFLGEIDHADAETRRLMLEVLTRRYYRIRPLERLVAARDGEMPCITATYVLEGRRIHLFASVTSWNELPAALAHLAARIADIPAGDGVVVDCFVRHPDPLPPAETTARLLGEQLAAARFTHPVRRIVFAVAHPDAGRAGGPMLHVTFRGGDEGFAEDVRYRGLHPMIGERLHLRRLEQFDIERLPSVEDVYLFRGVARENRKDERLFALAEVRDLTPVRDATGRVTGLPHLERMLLESLAAMRMVQAHRPDAQRLQWNRVLLYVWPPLTLAREEVNGIIRRLAPATRGVGLEQVVVHARVPEAGGLRDTVIRVSTTGGELLITFGEPSERPLRPLSEYEQTVVALRRRGLTYPYDLIRMLAPARGQDAGDVPPGEFVEHDLGDDGALVPVERAPGGNVAKVVVGLIRNVTPEVPEGMQRVIILGDASKEMGALAEPECQRINAAIDLAERLDVPLEWFALSAGAKISMESGTENMDWIARVLRRLIEFTQRGGEVNVVVCGINVGAQPYWNAEATMLMHTRGILVMVPDGAMVLTGKQALDYSGGVSAEDNLGIGGYDRIMGPNGQAQYHAGDLADACHILLRHYAHTYVVPGEPGPRRAATSDPADRDVRSEPHGGPFATVGDVFSDTANPGRKQPFDVRAVMAAVVDRDHRPLERWRDMRDAEIPVVWDARLGGHAVCLIGIESHPLPRLGFIPADGPEVWTGGTLFPRGSKKVARAVNAASGNRPLVVLANLSGFDGSPESMREWQLEYGAEIGRAVVNFRGPIVFLVISRYHGGAFVVFSKALNERIEAAALEGSYASVIGGAPAAAVVFTREVDARTGRDERIRALQAELAAAPAPDRPRLRARLAQLTATVRAEKLGEVADEFDRVHSVERALRTGSLDAIIPASRFRPWLIEAIERGLASGGP